MVSHGRLLTLVLVVGVLVLAASATSAAAQQVGDLGLPANVAQTIRSDLAARTGVPTASVSFVRVDEVTWSDGCVGIYRPGVACTLALVPGWVAWAQAGSLAYRYHAAADAAGFAAGGLDPATVASAVLPPGAIDGSTPNGTTRAFSGTAPPAGSVGLLVTARSATASDLAASLEQAGCDVQSLAIVIDGAWRVHVRGAPAAVNAGFPAALDAATPFFVRCAARTD